MRVCTKWGVLSEERWDKGATNKRKERIILRPGHLFLDIFFGVEKEWRSFLSYRLRLLSIGYGDEASPRADYFTGA